MRVDKALRRRHSREEVVLHAPRFAVLARQHVDQGLRNRGDVAVRSTAQVAPRGVSWIWYARERLQVGRDREIRGIFFIFAVHLLGVSI